MIMDKRTWTPPYLGAAYYPEDWPLEQIDEDIALMNEAGLNVARIAEFAWSTMEPREREYDFGWLHTAVDKLADAGIATVMCTPTCTPPAWLSECYPEILFVGADGQSIGHGGRRHACPNSPVYRDHCERIIRRMCEEFGHDDRIIGWQIDNEVYGNGKRLACACPVCIAKFRESLKQRFGTIDKLNQAWCTSLWSQTYQSFDQVPPPRHNVWHHPSLLQAWERFHSDSYIDFVEHQARLLHELTDVPVGTDMMMLFGVDHYKANRKLDVVQYNHYHLGEGFRDSAFWFDYIRPIKKDVPFWNTETSTCWGGGATYQEAGFCRANSWLPIAQGGEANMFWLWRTHWAGQELMHGSVISSCGRPMHIFGEVQEVAKGYEAAKELINGTKPVPSGLGIHLSDTVYTMFKTQSPAEGFDYLGTALRGVYHPTVRAQFRPDVISPCVDLDDYTLIVSPFLMTLEESGLSDRLRRWIENGGTWIAGPLTDIRTIDGAKYTHAPFGVIEDLGGVYCKYDIPASPHAFKSQWTDGGEFTGSVWYSGLEPRGAEVLATYSEGPCEGLAAVTSHKLGRGRVIVLGTLPPSEDFVRLLSAVADKLGIKPVVNASDNVLVVPRSGEAGSGLIAVELDNKPAWIELPRAGTDLITGSKLSGKINVGEYGVLAVRYDD
jgi:beta-galactosidase